MKDEKDLLYQELPSITPRVSREERLSQQRKGGCLDCNPSLNRAKQGSKYLYYFYIGILGVSFLTIQFLKNRQNNSYKGIETQHKTITVTFSQKIYITLIDQPNRYGLSLLFRNNSNQDWNIKNIQFNDTKINNNQPIIINNRIKSKDFHTIFVPLKHSLKNINDIELRIDS